MGSYSGLEYRTRSGHSRGSGKAGSACERDWGYLSCGVALEGVSRRTAHGTLGTLLLSCFFEFGDLR